MGMQGLVGVNKDINRHKSQIYCSLTTDFAEEHQSDHKISSNFYLEYDIHLQQSLHWVVKMEMALKK